MEGAEGTVHEAMEVEEPLVSDLIEESSGPQTFMDQLRAKRKEIAETRSTFLTIPGYEETGMVVQHRLMDRPEIEIIGRKVQKETKNRSEKHMRILIDMIIESTTGFYRSQIDGEPEPLPSRDEDVPVISWEELAVNLGWEPTGNERAAVYYIFGNNEFAIGQYGIGLNRWMGNTGLDVDSEFLGEGV